MKKLLIMAFAASAFAACCNNGGVACDARNLDRAKATLDSIYAHYGVAENRLLRENYPFNVDYTASYLASADQARPNPYSYLWPFSGTLSAVNAILEADASYRSVLDGRVLLGLAEYLDTTRMPAAYASYINTASASDRFYDDNVWLGIDFCDIYEATGDKRYLAQGKALYAWTKKHLLDPEDGLYFDNIGLDGRIGRAKFAYNSGQMVQAGALLYKATGDESYLKDAQRTAAACYDRFFGEFTPQGGETFRIINKGNVWFSAVMVRGLAELYAIDGNAAYLGDVQRTLDYAWEHARDAQGLFETDFTGADKQSEKWLLTQGAMAEMYGRMSGVKLDQTK